MTIREVAQAKINLCLHIVGQRSDGYHLLDSIVGFSAFGDVLTFEHADQTTLTLGGPFADGLLGEEDNLILKAARCFGAGKGAKIHLEKNLPIASGIGGGSADAAAALRGLSRLWDEPLPTVDVQLSLGADVPVCMAQRTVRMTGIGETILPVQGLEDRPMVLVNPNVPLSTPTVFRALKTKTNPAIEVTQDDPWTWIVASRNDLQPPAIATEPVVADVIAALNATGPALARMSGSGATCFGIYDTTASAEAAACAIASDNPDWWVQTTRLTT